MVLNYWAEGKILSLAARRNTRYVRVRTPVASTTISFIINMFQAIPNFVQWHP